VQAGTGSQPSSNMTAITPSRGRKPRIFGRRFGSKLRPRLGVIETPSGDGMTTKRLAVKRTRTRRR
jgi:hypothetical protein